MTEPYIYLGTQQDTFFFLHQVQVEERFRPSISYQLLNCMINDGMVGDTNKACIVYDVYKDNTIRVTAIQHKHSANKRPPYSVNSLQQQLARLLAASRKDVMLVYCYVYDKVCYESYERQEQLPTIARLSIDRQVTYIETSKPLNGA